MLQNWLKPLNAALLKSVQNLPGDALGRHLLCYTKDLPDLRKTKIALIGTAEKETNPIREQLYKMVGHFPKGSIADLGNLRKSDISVLIPVLQELLSSKIIPVVLAGADDWAPAQFLAYQENKALVNLTIVDEKPRFATADTVYSGLLNPCHPLLFHLSIVGYQLHQTPQETLDYLSRHHFDALRLGRCKAVPEETEPYLRDADAVAFHLSALKQSDAPGVSVPTPSGFFLEEACQLCRYAGMSDKLTSFGLYGFRPDRDRDAQTAQAAAQMLWYFLDGVFNRKNDYPVSKDGLTEYIVEFRKLNYQLTFWKSTKSGRWWMQIPLAVKRKYERHRLVPCSYQDYQYACREELPDRLMAALQRFE
jgi:formiminoglutamase